MFNLSKKFNKISFILLCLGIGIGFFLIIQLKTPVVRVVDPISPYISLQDTKDVLVEEQDHLKNKINILQTDITKSEEELKKYTASQKTVEEIENYKKNIGLTKRTGQGIIIKIDDSKKAEVSIDSITHAADLRDIVNFLWGVGAEAISINDERIVFVSSIDCIVNTILINSTKTAPPFEIKVIGKPKDLEDQVNNSNNLKDIKKRVKNQGLILEVIRKNDITILPYDGSFVIEYAKIAEANE